MNCTENMHFSVSLQFALRITEHFGVFQCILLHSRHILFYSIKSCCKDKELIPKYHQTFIRTKKKNKCCRENLYTKCQQSPRHRCGLVNAKIDATSDRRRTRIIYFYINQSPCLFILTTMFLMNTSGNYRFALQSSVPTACRP